MKINAAKRLSTVRRGAAGLAVAAVLATTAVGAAGAPALAADTPADSVPTFAFGDCPDLPAGVDPAQWRCEVLTATGSLTLGNRTVPALAPMTITHAEGPLPDGSAGQVFGALRAAPTAVPGGLLGIPGTDHGRALALSLRPEYGGRSDFYSTGDSLGLFTMRFGLHGRLLPKGCTIGADTPVELRLRRVGGAERVSKNPPIIKFDAYDDTFGVPSAQGCGPLGRLLDDRLGLPAATGNSLSLTAYYTYRTYDQLPSS
ncbi:hypothetical protein [Streptomyces olivochromogenes]|uniref:hypothetical protein n=1 Tax=Streptomyces olivochromogenes TaxID=1963 RepID=UPI001F38693A|nr:hypothetical protein [Streptomyces olivochromogenes]MCF3129535.1 hypothetical protein [Streptomyces olivochromogenes]